MTFENLDKWQLKVIEKIEHQYNTKDIDDLIILVKELDRQITDDKTVIRGLESKISELEDDNNKLKNEVTELTDLVASLRTDIRERMGIYD